MVVSGQGGPLGAYRLLREGRPKCRMLNWALDGHFMREIAMPPQRAAHSG